MTRTQKLGLCTWLPEDPVSLAEVNDNFTRLDASGGQIAAAGGGGAWSDARRRDGSAGASGRSRGIRKYAG